MYLKKTFLQIIILLFTLFPALKGFSQIADWDKLDEVLNAEIKPAPSFNPVPVLLMGTFHFDYPNLDGHKTDSSKMINIFSKVRQDELRLLLDIIKDFSPTRIYIESGNQKKIDSLYSAFRQDKFKLGRNEIFQIGFKLAKELNHDKIYAVDAGNFAKENYNRFGTIDSLWKDRRYTDVLQTYKWDSVYHQFYKEGDSLTVINTLLETFLITSDIRTGNKLNGHQLVSKMGTVDNKAPDALALQWYSRNLRIFNNILNTVPQSGDRILVLFGAGHLSVLHHLFDSSPQFKLIPFLEIVKNYEANK